MGCHTSSGYRIAEVPDVIKASLRPSGLDNIPPSSYILSQEELWLIVVGTLSQSIIFTALRVYFYDSIILYQSKTAVRINLPDSRLGPYLQMIMK